MALISLTGGTKCGYGGIKAAFGIDNINVTAATYTSGVLTAITVTSSFSKYTPDDEDDVSLFEQLQDAPGAKVQKRAVLKVNGISQVSVDAGNQFSKCCGTTWIIFLNNGEAFAIGVVPEDASWRFDVGQVRAFTRLAGDTGANKSRTEVEIVGSDFTFGSTTDLTIAEVEAL